ncbi:type II toxin-antitoxin system Phd/YefM family antitoxin [Sphaerisporangium album]|uniref:type II toxin-antitoxin system Phd/YefM family antitoxin n=1 Tax=Sphaerisporangium album TaxID=509200 RepID=UPI0015F08391|nr:type II toxin-antitoxin system Phd/YefM family antitoxin [Sphaerisporangium album]
MGQWQLQEVKQKLGEVIRRAHDEGPQVITRHGEEVAVVIDIAEYRRLKYGAPDFKEFLRSAPDLSLLEIHRAKEPIVPVELV